MRDVPLPDPVSAPHAEPAVDILRTAIAESATPVVLLTLGPLTNVSELLASQPDVRSGLAEVVVMGGALEVSGNVGDGSERAEWNIYVAPSAAHDVLRSGVPLRLVALDATSDVPVTLGFVDRLRARPKTSASTYVGNLLAGQDEFVRSGQYFFWDPFAAATAIDHRLAGFVERGLDVDLRPGGPNGSLVVVDGDPRVSVAVSADANAFEQSLLDTLSPAST
jgi:pyrimidine-specific ribonucleoside hydrolase